MPNLPITQGCTGCGACAQSCAKQAIKIVEDKEGFFVPQVDLAKCVDCGLCEKMCHVLNRPVQDLSKQKAYAVINYEDRKKSSSGGAFSMFARYVLGKGGVVFGAAYDPFPTLKHITIESLDELDRLRGSKYVQSEIGDTYKQVKDLLKTDRIILYTGTPCQIGGLYAYLGGKRYEGQLITLDLVCHGVPNQITFKAYLEKLKKTKYFDSAEPRNFVAFRFRNLDSWSIVPAVKISKPDKWKLLNQEANVFMTAFFRKSIFREGCYSCQYSNMNRIGTFTIADYWGVGSQGTKFKKNVAAGVSLVIDNCGSMQSMMPKLEKLAYIEERPLNECRAKNHNLNVPSERPISRDTAVKDMLDPDMSLMQYAQKYHMLDGFFKNLIKTTFKNVVYGLNLYNVYKTIIYKLGRTS